MKSLFSSAKMRGLAALLGLTVLGGCSFSPHGKFFSQETDSNGVLQGFVIDEETGMRVIGVEVAVMINGKWRRSKTLADNASTAINEAGTFVFDGLPVGNMLRVYFGGMAKKLDEKKKLVDGDKYAVRYMTVAINPVVNGTAADTELLVNNHPMLTIEAAIVKLGGTFSGRVLADQGMGDTTDALSAVAGATVVIMLPDFDLVTRVDTSPDGSFAFTDLPRTTIAMGNVVVLPVDHNGDGVFEFASWASTRAVALAQRGTDSKNPFVINLKAAKMAPELVWANVEMDMNFRPMTSEGKVELLFSIPMDNGAKSLEAVTVMKLIGADPNNPADYKEVAVNKSFDSANVQLSLTPVAPFERGARYKVVITNMLRSINGAMFGGSVMTFQAIKGEKALKLAEKPTISRFDGKDEIDWNTTMVTFHWDTVDDAVSYKVFGKSPIRTDYVEIAAPVVNSDTTSHVDLDLSSFDVFPDDVANQFTPFTNKGTVSIVIVPVDRDGVWSFPTSDDAMEVTLKDEKRPTIISSTSVDMANAGDEDASGRIEVEFSEYMDITAGKPTITCTDDNNDKKTASGTWHWVVPADGQLAAPVKVKAGYFDVTIGKGINHAGDNCDLKFKGTKDNSGNEIDADLSTRKHLI